MKKIFAIIMSVMMIACFMPTAAFANGGGGSGTSFTCSDNDCTTKHVAEVTIGENTAHYSTLLDALKAANGYTGEGDSASYGENKEATVKLLKDVDGTKNETWRCDGQRNYLYYNGARNGNKVTLETNGHNITFGKGQFLVVNGGSFEIKNGGKTESVIKESDYWLAPIHVIGSTDSAKTNYSKLTVGKNVTLEGYCGIKVNYASDEVYDGYGIEIEVKGTLIGHADSEKPNFVGAGIDVDGKLNKTKGNVPKITLNGCNIKSDGNGIYAAGYAKWTLKNTEVNAPSAMCIKSGDFTIESGEYYSSGSYDNNQTLVEREGSVDTGAVLNIINENGYAGKINVGIKGGTFNSASGYAVYQGSVGNAASDAVIKIENGEFTGKDGAMKLTNITNKKVVEKGIFSSDPTEYLAEGKVVTAINGKYYVSKTNDEIRTDSERSAWNQGIELAPLTKNKSEYQITEWNGQKITIKAAPQLCTESEKEGKWIGIAVPVPTASNGNTQIISYKLSNGVTANGTSLSESDLESTNKNIIVKKVTIGEKTYIAFYWDYDDEAVNWIKYKFSADNSQDQYNQVFVDVVANPADITEVIGHKAGKDACIYEVKYANGVATVNYCGLAEGTQAVVKVPVKYEVEGDEDTYLYFKYNDASAWTMMGKGELDKDGEYYEYCYIDLKDGNKVKLQYKYGPVVANNETGTWIDPVQTGVYTLEVVAKKVDGQTAKDAKHSWNSGKITKEATAEADGEIVYTCTRCGATETKTIEKHTHTLQKVDGKAATTTEDGWKDYYKCTGDKCDMHWSDAKGENVIADLDAWKVGDGKIAKKGSSSGGSSGGGYVTPGNTTNTTGTTTTTAKPTTTTAGGVTTTSAALSESDANTLVNNAVTNKSTNIVINAATGTAVKEAVAGTKTEITIPSDAVSQIVEKTDASVTLKSDVANVTFDKTAMEQVAAAAGKTGNVKLIVNVVAQNEDKVQLELKLETANGTVSDFGGGNVSVTVKLSAALAAKDVVCVYIDDNSVYHKVAGTKNADGTFTFTTVHFSSYAVMPTSDADKVIAEQDAKAKDLTKALKLTARSAKTAKGNIKIALTVDNDAIKEIEDLGYTVKYKFYRSTKKAASYKAKYEKAAKTYTNTAGTKGTKYYYKARVMVYDADGTLVAKTELKQCKYACRVK